MQREDRLPAVDTYKCSRYFFLNGRGTNHGRTHIRNSALYSSTCHTPGRCRQAAISDSMKFFFVRQKKRKAIAGKCSITAAVTSTTYTQQKQQQRKKHEQQNSQFFNKEILNQNHEINQNQEVPPANIAATRKTTIAEGKQTTKRGRTIDNNNDTDDGSRKTTPKQLIAK